MRKTVKRLFPINSPQRKILSRISSLFGIKNFGINSMHNFVVEKTTEIQRLTKYEEFKNLPLISIVVPTFGRPSYVYLETLVNSVLNQSYSNFELVIANGSTDNGYIKFVEQLCGYDHRLRVISVTNNGISENTNTAIKVTKGEYVALLDHDDMLHPDALYYIVQSINNHPNGDLFYTDETKLSEDGEIFLRPLYKPAFSRDLLLNLNYITHFAVIRKALFKKVGLFNKEMDGAQDYDMFLRISDMTDEIIHIPKILYFWREAHNSTAISFSNKVSINTAGEKTLSDHFERVGLEAYTSMIEDTPGFYDFDIKTKNKKVSIIINIENSSFANNYLDKIKGATKSKHTLKWYLVDDHISIPKDSDYVIIVSELALPRQENWVDKFISTIQQPHVGIVTGTLVNYFDIVIYKGEILTQQGEYELFTGMKLGETSIFGDVNWNRNVDSVKRGVICFESGLIGNVDYRSCSALITEVNKVCANKLYTKVVLGRTIFEKTFGNHIEASVLDSFNGFFNPNLSIYNADNFDINYDQQIPTTERYDLMKENK